MKLFKKNKPMASQQRRPLLKQQPRATTQTMYYSSRQQQNRTATSSGASLSDIRGAKSESGAGKKSVNRFTKVINALIVVGIFGLLFVASTLSDSVAITLPDSAYTYRDKSEYEQFAKEYLRARPIQRSKLLFRSTSFESAFTARFPEIRRAEAILPLADRTLTLSLALSEPLAVIQNGQERGVLDASGVLATKNITESMKNLVTIELTDRQDQFSEGDRILTTDEVLLLRVLLAEMPNALRGKDMKGLTVSSVQFSVKKGQMAVYFRDAPYYVKVSTYVNAQQQVGRLLATLRRLAEEGTTPASYIDVRVDSRAYVL